MIHPRIPYYAMPCRHGRNIPQRCTLGAIMFICSGVLVSYGARCNYVLRFSVTLNITMEYKFLFCPPFLSCWLRSGRSGVRVQKWTRDLSLLSTSRPAPASPPSIQWALEGWSGRGGRLTSHFRPVPSLITRSGVRGAGWGLKSPPEIPKALQNRAKLNLIVKNAKNCWI